MTPKKEIRASLDALAVMSDKPTIRAYKPRRKPVQHEAQLQTALFEWAQYNANKYPELKVLHAIPNGGKRDITTAARLKREGVLSGVSDIHLPVPRGGYCSLWLELKVGNNKPTENQKWFIDEMTRYGHYACVVYSLDEAIRVIENYLKGGNVE